VNDESCGAVLGCASKNEWSLKLLKDGRDLFIPCVMVLAEKRPYSLCKGFYRAGCSDTTSVWKRSLNYRCKISRRNNGYAANGAYRNMKEGVDKYPQVVAYAEEAIKRAALPLKKKSIRGGTDGSGSVISACPAPIFLRACKTSIAIRMDWYKDMAKAAETIVHCR